MERGESESMSFREAPIHPFIVIPAFAGMTK
jgi:hypothetical protein